MGTRPLNPVNRKGQIRARELSKVASSTSAHDNSSPSGGLGGFNSGSGHLLYDNTPKPLWIALTGNTGNAYAWTGQMDDGAGNLVDDPNGDSGTDTDCPAYEINGIDDLPIDGSFLVRAYPASDGMSLLFDAAAAGTAVGTHASILCGSRIGSTWYWNGTVYTVNPDGTVTAGAACYLLQRTNVGTELNVYLNANVLYEGRLLDGDATPSGGSGPLPVYVINMGIAQFPGITVVGSGGTQAGVDTLTFSSPITTADSTGAVTIGLENLSIDCSNGSITAEWD